MFLPMIHFQRAKAKMSNPPRTARNHGKDGSNTEVEKLMAKSAGFVVFFSEIVISILKNLNPLNSNHKMDSTLQHQHVQIPVTTSAEQNVECWEGNVAESKTRAVEIVKGDTLWGLSRKYGVSIKAIKEANGLTSDIIYAVKKLTIP